MRALRRAGVRRSGRSFSSRRAPPAASTVSMIVRAPRWPRSWNVAVVVPSPCVGRSELDRTEHGGGNTERTVRGVAALVISRRAATLAGSAAGRLAMRPAARPRAGSRPVRAMACNAGEGSGTSRMSRRCTRGGRSALSRISSRTRPPRSPRIHHATWLGESDSIGSPSSRVMAPKRSRMRSNAARRRSNGSSRSTLTAKSRSARSSSHPASSRSTSARAASVACHRAMVRTGARLPCRRAP